MDNPKLVNAEALAAMKAKAIKIARKASKIMGINMSTAITCVKPSGTVSQLVDSASGLHTRFAKWYLRRYRISSTDSLIRMLRDQGIALSPENGQSKADWSRAARMKSEGKSWEEISRISTIFQENDEWSEDKVSTWVVSFPVKAPDKCITRTDVNAVAQLEHYKKLQENWCEHNASATIYVKDEEWFEVGNWVYKNWDIINGVSFLPFDGGKYEQAPYEEITEKQYKELYKAMPKIDYTQLSRYEMDDNTEGAKALACAAGVCELN
jgi:hypothetical protein